MLAQSLAPRPAEMPVSGPYKVDITQGGHNSRVSSEWFSRPDDERYLSLSSLYEAVRGRADRAATRTVETRSLRVIADRGSAEALTLAVPGRDAPIAPTHWSYGQLCSVVGAPAGYLRQLPAPLSAINLQHGLLSHRGELVKTLETQDGRTELRAVTGPDYGRIWDHELVAAVMKIAGDGTGDTRWKVPGLLDWSTITHNPFVQVTKDTTTLYASDRDVFLFLVDDAHPIEAGRLPNGDPDLYFRGFYAWNSEVGSKTLGIASFFLRAVCMNRTLWGVTLDTCLGLDLTSVSFGVQVPGLADSAPAVAIGERHASWRDVLPSRPEDLWAELQGWDGDSRDALFAHCAAMSVNAVHEARARRPRALAQADQLAQALDLDMAAAGWEPTVDGYLGRVTKARILEAVREGCGEAAAERLVPLKKGDMAEQAQALLAGSGWLPTPLRTPGKPMPEATESLAAPLAIAAE